MRRRANRSEILSFLRTRARPGFHRPKGKKAKKLGEVLHSLRVTAPDRQNSSTRMGPRWPWKKKKTGKDKTGEVTIRSFHLRMGKNIADETLKTGRRELQEIRRRTPGTAG